MITIKIKNVKEVVRNQKGTIFSIFGTKFIDCEKIIEKEIIKQIKNSLKEKGIEAEVKIK